MLASLIYLSKSLNYDILLLGGGIVGIDFFPANRNQALAYLWLSKQDLKDVAPEDVFSMYQDALDRINDTEKTQRHFKNL